MCDRSERGASVCGVRFGPSLGQTRAPGPRACVCQVSYRCVSAAHAAGKM